MVHDYQDHFKSVVRCKEDGGGVEEPTMTVQSWEQAVLATRSKQRWISASSHAKLASFTRQVTFWHSPEERGEEKHMTSYHPPLITCQDSLLAKCNQARGQRKMQIRF